MPGARTPERTRGTRGSFRIPTLFRPIQFLFAGWIGLATLWAPPAVRAQDAVAPAATDADTAAEIVYIDANGFIRVHDPVAPAGAPLVAWGSPSGGWHDAALGDFNNDGENEIVAVGGQGSGGKLAVFDPVVAEGIVAPNQQYNGLYWEALFEFSFPATPHLVATGEFDPTSAGREIVAVHDLPDDAGFGEDGTRAVVLSQRSATPDGRRWQVLAEVSTAAPWSDITTGDLEATGIDNVVLIDEDDSRLSVYRLLGASLVAYYTNQSGSREWSDAAIGQVDPTTAQPELVLVRNADPQLPSLIVWRYNGNDTFVDVNLRRFFIPPRVVFLANITGTLAGQAPDHEMFLLRNVPGELACTANPTPPPQLLMRNLGTDTSVTFEVCLDQYNTYRYGAGGDLDGDGKDEIAVISPTALRIFNSPDTSTTDVTNVALSSNGLTIAIGDLDRHGSALPDTLGIEGVSVIEASVAAGDIIGPFGTKIINATNERPLPIYIRVSPPVSFLRYTLSSSTTPSDLSITVDASELLPGGVYGTNLQIISGRERVANTPLTIAVLVRTTPGVIVKPAGTTVVMRPCAAPATPPTVALNVWGTAGSTFSGEVVPHAGSAAADVSTPLIDWKVNNVPWVSSAASLTTTVPSSITLTLDPSKASDFSEDFVFDQADVVVKATVPGVGEVVERRATITLVCAPNVVYLPVIGR